MAGEANALKVESIGGVATAEQGVVLLDGPDGVAVSMTPHAAESTAHSLLAAARQAQAQRETETPSS